MSNRLALETSPYLLQHAGNPVAWQPWDDAALDEARRADRPILLSIGYSTCHWCHVMARESFEDAAVAARMNRDFVCIKVDREERPDLDQIYQTALQMLTGRAGGWPLTMFLAPDGTPFHGGTYFPDAPRHGLPGFGQVLAAVARAWQDRRGDIQEQNAVLRDALATAGEGPPSAAPLSGAPIQAALAEIKRGFDPVHGGFGRAPKFPRPAELEFLLWSGDAEARRMALFTLERMAEGGLMDQLGGGFFRYAVDERWAIPHFEKMLYDNGPLLGLYADAWALTGDPRFERAARMLVGWLEREMRSPEGLFHAALDADSEHEEGRFYLWTPDAAARALPAEAHAVAAAHWGLDGAPNFEARAWHLCVERALPEVAQTLGLAEAAASRRLEAARAALLAARELRVRPGRDDKMLTAWNALMIKGLARAGRRFDRPDWTRLAAGAADALNRLVWRDGRLAASYQHGRARHNGYLDDHAFLLDALLELLQADWRADDLAWARQLADVLIDRFQDQAAGGFYFTSHDHERLIQRTKPGHDNATPAGNGVAALALGRLALLVDAPRHRAAAERAVRCFLPQIAAQPAPFPSLLAALRECLTPARVVVLRGPEPALTDWKRAADRVADAGTLLFKPPGNASDISTSFDKPVDLERVNAYVCAGVNCLPAIRQLHELLAILDPGGGTADMPLSR